MEIQPPPMTCPCTRCASRSPQLAVRSLLGVVAGLMGILAGCETGRLADSPLLRLCDPEPEAIVPGYVLDGPEATIDGNRTDPPLSPPIIFPTLAPGGGISLASAYQAPVLTFDSTGTHRMSVGSHGTGPGEWSSTASGGVTWLADTLVVAERRPPRIHRFHTDGSLIDTRQVPSGPVTVSFLLAVHEGSGTLVVLPPPMDRAPERLAHLSLETGLADSLGTFQQRATFRLTFPDGSAAVGLRPMGDHLLIAVDPSGSGVVLVDRAAPADAEESFWRLRRIDAQGRTVLDRPICHHPVTVSERHLRDSIQTWTSAFSTSPSAQGVPEAELERIVSDALDLPEYWPPVDRVVAGADGSILLRRETRVDSLAVWESRDVEGELTGILILHEDRWILAAEGGNAGDAVWTERRDPNDVPILERSRIMVGEPESPGS